ncbi:MAG: NADPH-dependent F420 reductase [Woeseiaceae bacterium]
MRIRVLIACIFTIAIPAQADTIAIIGTGSVGAALGPEFAAQGHTIIYGSRDPGRQEIQDLVAKTGDGTTATAPAESVIDADIVVLAVPGLLVEEITLGLGNLTGKIIIDPTNPLLQSNAGLMHGVATSNAEVIQAAAPGADVVKAFNTLSWTRMVEPESAGGPVSIPLCGDSDAAKAVVANLIEGMDLEAIDVGPIENSRWVEGMAILLINNLYGSDRPNFDFHLRKN